MIDFTELGIAETKSASFSLNHNIAFENFPTSGTVPATLFLNVKISLEIFDMSSFKPSCILSRLLLMSTWTADISSTPSFNSSIFLALLVKPLDTASPTFSKSLLIDVMSVDFMLDIKFSATLFSCETIVDVFLPIDVVTSPILLNDSAMETIVAA